MNSLVEMYCKGFGGLDLIESSLIVKQFRFPRTKKRRIRKKWSKIPSNFKPDSKAYKIGNKIYCHPQFAAKIKNQLKVIPHLL